MISADVGVSTPLELMLFDGATTKGVRVRIRTTAGVLVTSVILTHVGEGLYTGTWLPVATGYFHANYTAYTTGACTVEDLLYTRTTELYKVVDPGGIDPDIYAHAVWDVLLGNFTVPGSFGEAIGIILEHTNPVSISSSVWDEFFADHRIPNTFGDMVQAIWEYCRVHVAELQNPIWGLDMIYSLIQNQTNTIISDVHQVDTKVDALTPLILGVETSLASDIDGNRILLTSMAIQNEFDNLQIIDEIHITNSKVDAVAALVGTLQNNTTARFVVPERLVKPTSGTKAYQFHLRIYDTAGAPKAPDSIPTIRVRRLDTGSNIVLDALMTPDGVKVGSYFYTYTIANSTPEYPALVEVTIVEDGVARYIPSVTEVTEFESDLNAIQAQLSAVDTKVSTTQTQLTSPVYGLAALKTGENDILSAISSESITLGQIKAKTDILPSNIATTTDINDMMILIGAKPDLTEITTVVNAARNTIMGSESKDLTDIYNLWDLSDVMKSNDPRLNFLDATISSRSTLTAHDVWHFGARTLTEYPEISYDSVKAIWDYLCTAANVPGSIGQRISEYLDASVSTRVTATEVMTALDGVAQEASLSGVRTELVNSLNDAKNKINNITVKVLQIKAKTDNLPTSPASETTLTSGVSLIRGDITEMDNRVIQIKANTDRIPSDPATQTAVHAIPTNPVLTTDPRLTNLDARISTRSTLSTADLVDLAHKTDVTSAKNNIISEVNQNQALINALTGIANHTKNDVDSIKLSYATMSALLSAEAAILDAIGHISVDADLDPAEIWAFHTRTLTTDPSEFGPDISNLATKSDVAAISSSHNVVNRMTTTFNPAAGIQEVLVWTERDGERALDVTDCTITIKDSLGVTKWSQSSSTANPDGMFRFINPIVVSSDSNYYIVMTVRVSGVTKITQQAFITIG